MGGTKVPVQTYEIASEGVVDAVCCEFVNLGIVQTSFGPKPKGMYIFQISELTEKGKFKGSRKEVRWQFPLSWGSDSMPSNMRKMIEKWRGKKMTEEERQEFEMESVVGKACRLVIEHNVTDKGTFANINLIMKKGDVELSPLNYTPLADRRAKAAAEEAEDNNAIVNNNDELDEELPF